jgi:hypothetical protein
MAIYKVFYRKILISLLISQTALFSSLAQAQEIEGATSTAAVPESSSTSSRGKWSVTFFTLGGVEDSQFRNTTRPSYMIYDSYFSFNYRFNQNFRLSARPAFSYTTAGVNDSGDEVTDKVANRDFSFVASQYNLFEDELPLSMEMRHSARLYLPTSDVSKAEGMIARLRYELEGKYFTEKYRNIRVWFKPSYYFQRTTAFINNFGDVRQTRNADSLHGAEYDHNLNKMFSIKPGFEFEEKWSFSSETNQCGSTKRPAECDVRRATTVAARLGFEVRPMRKFNFTLGIGEERDLINTQKERVVSYTLLTNLVLY